MLGAIIGDIIGSFYEWNNVKTVDFDLFPKEATFTDDTVMTLAVAKWLIEDKNHTDAGLVKTMQELGRKYPNAGYGGHFYDWIFSDNPQPYNSWGNGSAMRVGPVGLAANNIEDALHLAEVSAAVTHNHPEGIKGAQAIAACVFFNRTFIGKLNERKQFIKDYVEHTFGYNLSRSLDEIRPNYKFDVSCQGSVPEAIIAFLEAETLEDCARKAVSLGGDSDTIAAMACSIFAAGEEGKNLASVDLSVKCSKYLTEELIQINNTFESQRHTPPLPQPNVALFHTAHCVPSLKVGQIIKIDEIHSVKVEKVKETTGLEIVYDATLIICYDFPPHFDPVEIVEYYENPATLQAFLSDVLVNYQNHFIQEGKRYIVRGNYEVGKLKEGSKVSLQRTQYEVTHICGHGSYGEILRLQRVTTPWNIKLRNLLLRENDNDQLVIKQFKLFVSKDPAATHVSEITAKYNFKRGYDDMSRLPHPNIVKVYDYFAIGDIPCFTMEYIEGYNLREFVERKGCLTEKDAKEIILTICKTIKYCHEKNVFHGDLKPNNVMITQKGIIKLIDFGGAYRCSDIVGIARVYFYLLTGVYLSTREHSKPTQEAKERIVTILNEKNASNLVRSQILYMLDYDIPAPFQSQTNTILDQMINTIENDQLIDYSYMPSQNDELIRDSTYTSTHSNEGGFNRFSMKLSETNAAILDSSDFIVFEQEGLYGMKNKQGEIVIPPLYSRISSLGSYHYPGPGPVNWHVVGVMTYRDGLTGWYEIVDGYQMNMVVELTEEQIKERQMWT